ncbi:helix-turn-helix domain-containing protein [Actinomadura rudentiformis]
MFAVARHGSVAQAERELHCSQPWASHHLSAWSQPPASSAVESG